MHRLIWIAMLALALAGCSFDPDAHPTAPVDALNRGEAASVLRYLIDPEAENARNQARIDAILAYESAENEHEAKLAAARAARDAEVAALWANVLRGLGIAAAAAAAVILAGPPIVRAVADAVGAVAAAKAGQPVTINHYNTLQITTPARLLPGDAGWAEACEEAGGEEIGGIWMLEGAPIAYLTMAEDN